jgi:phenylalanyl-tRNA synthetase beta chain
MQHHVGFGQTPVFIAELNLDPLLELKTGSVKLAPLSKFPIVTRDLAFILKNDISFQNIVKTIKKAGKKLVDEVLLLDRYVGANLATGTHSLAVRIRLLSYDKTLTEEEISMTITAIQSSLVQDYQVVLRISA